MKFFNVQAFKVFRYMLIIILSLTITACYSKKYPSNYPPLIIECNGVDLKTEVNEVTWIENGGNSLISVPEFDITNHMEPAIVNSNDKLTLKIGYDSDISKIKVIRVEMIEGHRREIPIELTDDFVQAPEEKGEYIYSIKVTWDSTPESIHFVSYVIKFKVI
ncbi:hypothetical protein HYH38_10285 [Clostridium botulinum]|uniref:hypothetical protein n=1 Tax=Clostridium botulinum TaxID=1491 RepID=UPI000174E873|nr:hypothetical protein [Clostridium botulinum]ACD51960.1 putative lipoprotein [Clostridium botulinum E3 str. Alaska E43]AJF30371.1 hypothetical protein ST13_11915 [Clostridium botulinum]MBY6788439.1 hypothetical protein [Clostridium botulinum]MBY6816079.1 hypothetical protein [Clostridium botulinum]MBY6827666.1 hypothetical protein [Clostridium botulinum]